jgi:ribonuclease Y
MWQELLILIFAVSTAGLAYYTFVYQKNNQVVGEGKTQAEVDKLIKEKVDLIRKEKQAQLDEFKQELKERFKEREDSLKEDLDAKNSVLLEKLKLEKENEAAEEIEKMRQRVLDLQENVNKKEEQLNKKFEDFDKEKDKLQESKEELKGIKQEFLSKKDELEEKEQELKGQIVEKLEEVSKLSMKDAKKKILKEAKEDVGQDLLEWQKKALEDVEQDANLKAREIVSLAIQRCSSEVANEMTITSIKLSSDEEKGKIIGKGGRNIQWLEKTLGVEIVVDETPEVVTISGFSSIRRHIAQKTIKKLLEDGRVHPSSIEEMYEKSKSELAQEIAEAGQWAVEELGIYDFPAKLVRILGRLKFRTSYGQNMLKHSVEMARLAGLIAREINDRFPHWENPVDVEICIKGALLHDIGKAVDEETIPKGNHITLGEKICDTFGLDWRVKKCVSSHHDESYYDEEHGFCIEAAIVDACDNISGGRPGARKESMEAYYQRMEALEKIAENTPGVNKSWVMKGSRELWVFFDVNEVTPAQVHDIVRDLTNKIQTDVKYPGEIKVVGIWEDKIVEYAH